MQYSYPMAQKQVTIVSFIYKGVTVATRRLDEPLTLNCCRKVRNMVKLKLLQNPKNFDSWKLTSGSRHEKLF